MSKSLKIEVQGTLLTVEQCLQRDRLVIPECKTKHDITQGAGQLGQNDATWGRES